VLTSRCRAGHVQKRERMVGRATWESEADLAGGRPWWHRT
jgi:hypothetical protein